MYAIHTAYPGVKSCPRYNPNTVNPSPITRSIPAKKRCCCHRWWAYRFWWRVGREGASLTGLLIFPLQAAFHRSPPAALHRVGLVAGHRRLEVAVELPQVGKVRLTPDSGAEPRQEGRTEGGRLGVARPADGDAEEIGLQLAEHVHDRGSTVHAQLGEPPPCVLF